MYSKFLYIIAFLFIFSQGLFASKVMQISIDGGIGASTAEFVKSAIEEADKKNYNALLIRLNTPGGLLDATRDIVSSIIESPVPVIVYVGPSGARAASAGTFITLAAHYAAMEQSTNIGAAHPVGLGGESDSSSVMNDKVENDAAAFIRSIASLRDRNQDWAEQTVRKSISSTAWEAYYANAIDTVVSSIDSLLLIAHNSSIELKSGKITLNTMNAEIVIREMNWREELLAFLSDPTFAYILIMLAMYGIMFELYNPGAIFPGVIGGIAAILAAYSLQMLPVNYAGLGLILLAIVLFIVEIKVVSYGLLSVAGVISFLLGSFMLIESPFDFFEISIFAIILSTVLTALFFFFVIGMGIKAQKRKLVSGEDAMIGEKGIAVNDMIANEIGSVKVHGELWKAKSSSEIKKGQKIEIVAIKGLLLTVKELS